MNRKRTYTGILLLLLMLATGCSSNDMTSIYTSNDKISSSTNSYNLDGVTQTIQGENFTGEVAKFEGMEFEITIPRGEFKQLGM